jgi:transposase-like protein
VERRKGQRYGGELRRQAVERMNACGNIVGLARELGVSRRVLYQWRDRMEQTDCSPGRSRELILRKQILKLKRLLANKTLETSVCASSATSRHHLQDSRPGWIRCSFPVGLFHPLQHAGLSRRTPGCP